MSAQIIFGESWDDYTKSEALGSSALHAWRGMGREAWSAAYLERGPGKRYSGTSSKFAAGGGALDALVTGGKRFEDCFVVSPYSDFRTKEAQAWKAEQAAAGREIITAQQLDEIQAAERLAKEALSVLAGGREISFQVTLRGEIKGVAVQTRPDFWIPGDDMATIGDLKYISDFDGFVRHIVGERIEVQLALDSELAIQAGAEQHRIALLVVESGTVHPRVAVYFVDPEDLGNMCVRLGRLCAEISDAMTGDLGFRDVIQFETLSLPGWARKQLEEASE